MMKRASVPSSVASTRAMKAWSTLMMGHRTSVAMASHGPAWLGRFAPGRSALTT